MTIRVVNATFESVSTADFDTIDDAFRAATAAGLEILTNEVASGLKSSIVEITAALDGQIVARGAVAVSTERFSDPLPG